MPITDLIPWRKTNGGLVTRRNQMDPLSQLHREVDRVFSDFMTDWPLTGPISLMGSPIWDLRARCGHH